MDIAHAVEEVDFQRLPIEVASEVENVDFDLACGFTECRIGADVNGRRVTMRGEMGNRRVDAVRGSDRRNIEQICRGEAQRAASFGSAADCPSNTVRMTKESHRVTDVA